LNKNALNHFQKSQGAHIDNFFGISYDTDGDTLLASEAWTKEGVSNTVAATAEKVFTDVQLQGSEYVLVKSSCDYSPRMCL
jgi:hypothetical protein